MIRRPPRSTHCISSAASDVYKRQLLHHSRSVAIPFSRPDRAPRTRPRASSRPRRAAASSPPLAGPRRSPPPPSVSPSLVRSPRSPPRAHRASFPPFHPPSPPPSAATTRRRRRRRRRPSSGFCASRARARPRAPRSRPRAWADARGDARHRVASFDRPRARIARGTRARASASRAELCGGGGAARGCG